MMDRKKVDIKYRWDLSMIYKSNKEFNNDISIVKKNILELEKYDGIKYNANSLYDLISHLHIHSPHGTLFSEIAGFHARL